MQTHMAIYGHSGHDRRYYDDLASAEMKREFGYLVFENNDMMDREDEVGVLRCQFDQVI